MLLWLLLPGGRTRRLSGDLVVVDDDGDQDDDDDDEDFDDRDADNGSVGSSDMMQMIRRGR